MLDKVKLIAADMDHTLLTEKGQLPPNLEHDILELDKFGIDFVIASGRPLYTLEAFFPKIKHRMSFISDNGALVSHKGSSIFKSLIEPASYQSMISFVENRTEGVAILCDLDKAYVSEKHKIYETYLKYFYSKISFVKNLNELIVEADKCTVYFPNKKNKYFYEKLFKPEYEKDFFITLAEDVWIDIMNLRVNKGKGLQLLGARLGLKYEQMMAFGDSYNDIEMLQAVKYSYIVKNAQEDMMHYAHFIADSNDHFGVTTIIEEVLQTYKTA
ncbi:putative Sugar phosphatase YbiV [Hollandina sp. SP2]